MLIIPKIGKFKKKQKVKILDRSNSQLNPFSFSCSANKEREIREKGKFNKSLNQLINKIHWIIYQEEIRKKKGKLSIQPYK